MPCAPERFAQYGGARAGAGLDAVDGVVPSVVVVPSTAEQTAGALAAAAREQCAVVLRGGATKLSWGRPVESMDVLLDLRRLNRLVVHRHGDLTATMEGGATLEEVNAQLAEHGQCLPIDSPFDGATIGGILATNDSGPLRHRWGTPRDLLIGVGLATIEGRVVHAGGHVVKNVAGYDLGKLVTGSFGSLAAIVDATFKLAPRPFASATAVAGFTDIQAVARVVAAIAGSQIEPLAFDVAADRPHDGPLRASLLVRFASTPRAVDAQLARVSALVGDRETTTVLRDTQEAEAWQRHQRLAWESRAVMKTSWRPADTAAVLSAIDRIAREAGVGLRLVGRAASGVGVIAVDGSPVEQIRVGNALRAVAAFGPVVLLKADRSVKEQLDAWGPMDEAAAAFQAVKRAFDPAAVLGAGRGPV